MKEILQAVGPGGLILLGTAAACVAVLMSFKLFDMALGLAEKRREERRALAARRRQTRRWQAQAANLNGIGYPNISKRG